MTQLISIECPCGQTFQTVPEVAITDATGNAVCDNCAVEKGLKDDVATQPPDKIETAPEGSEARKSKKAG